ncbi:KGP2 kinase, partial [Polypterus senegalus]
MQHPLAAIPDPYRFVENTISHGTPQETEAPLSTREAATKHPGGGTEEPMAAPPEHNVKKLVLEALNKNQFLKRLDPQQIRDMVECMYERSYHKGDHVIKQGEPGNHLFVLAAVSDVKTWALDREVFQNIMRKTAQARHEQYRNFLRSVNLITHLPEDKLSKIVDCLEVEYYDTGDYIIREGEEGSTFYIIAKGKIDPKEGMVIFPVSKRHIPKETGNYPSDDVRSASIIADENDVECLVIDREASSCDRWSPAVSLEMIQLKDKVSGFSSTSPFQNLEIIATLGVGGFGRVELVKVKNEDVTFAMKCIKKKHIVDNRQEEHIHSERKILEEACSPFVVKLYRTFKDSKYVYMLLEACLGGEIWSLLRDRGSFDEQTAKFCVTCVTEAFDYLHQIGVVYRDLKPENLMLDSAGYIKLVDFGFAKKIDWGQKTWTFCGTPEYVAPEIILNKGHDFSVDFWSLGILVFELLTGKYLVFMCYRQNSTERLGNLKNGINDIKKHRQEMSSKVIQSHRIFLLQLQGPTDHSYFDNYPPDEDIPPDELSGWDNDF